MTTIDYAAPAEFYLSGSTRRSQGMSYRRFASAAEAVQYVVEDMAPASLKGSLLEVNEQRFTGADILSLYTDGAYPLKRRKAS